MAKILSYYQLCPINDETGFLGLSQDVESGTVINTLGKNIIINVKLSNQKQINSWAVQEKLSSKVVYDFNKKVYVGVFGHKWIRCWPSECTDINKIKRIKLSKPIENLISIPNQNTIVLYTDGTCESLECAIDIRKEKKDPILLQNKPIVDPVTTEIFDPTFFKTANETILFTYFTRKSNDVRLVFFELNSDTLRIDSPVTKLKLVREDRDTKLVGCTVCDSILCPQLVTIWSDNRLFLLPLRATSSLSKNVPGDFVAMINVINVNHRLAILGIDRDCIAIYGANATQDGGTLILYNTQFKVIESKQQFKVYFNNPRLWTIEKYIFLAVGQMLGVAKFRVSKEQLSDMIGSQRVTDSSTYVDTECINADGVLEDMIEFDMSAQLAPSKPLNKSSETNGIRIVSPKIETDANLPYELVESVENDFRTLQKYDLSVAIEEDEELAPGMLQLKLSSNVNSDSFDVASVQALANELERIGASEYEITECMIPLLLQANLDDDLLTCLRTYSNVSEKSLVDALKYFIDAARAKTTESLSDDDKTVNGLNAVLSSTFDQELILDHLRTKLDTDDVLYLLNHIFAALEADDVQLEQRPQIDNSFGDDEQLIKWACAIIDAHFQQFLISRDDKLVILLTKWKELIDSLVQDIRQTTSISAALRNILAGKTIKNESSGSKWYSVEAFKLY